MNSRKFKALLFGSPLSLSVWISLAHTHIHTAVGENPAHIHTVSYSQSQGWDQHDMSNYNLPKIHFPLYTNPV